MTPRQAIDDYLRMRRALGFALVGHDRLLLDFVEYLDHQHVSTITTQAAVAWATKPMTAQPVRWNARLCVVRGFVRYLHTLDPQVQVPPADVLPHRAHRPRPYIFSASEIESLVAAAARLRPPIRAFTHQTLFGLLAATGLRVGEGIGLNDDDIGLDTGLLTIIDSKFHRGRTLPLHPTVVAALRRYKGERDSLCLKRNTTSFFVSTTGTRLIYTNVRATFQQLIGDTGIGSTNSVSPRIHGLRHTFTVTCIIDWYRRGNDVAAMMPLLSAYLGHVSPESTYWYEQATPELLSRAAGLLERDGRIQP